ncbi:MAG TPA: hypothetical protein P5084_09845 [Paludibacter sp.]|nr:hypothetical protein [Paludibacter sp.]
MKSKNLKMTGLTLLVSIILIFSFSSCTYKTKFLTSVVVPAAQGTVQIKTDANKNYAIKIKISNLAPSTRLSPPRDAYVVWLVTVGKVAKNLGQLNSSSDFMSKNLNASFETISGLKPSKIIITAENDVYIQNSSFSDVILTTDYINFED